MDDINYNSKVVCRGDWVKIKEGYLLRKVADENIVIYMGEEEGAFEGMIQLNSAGVFLWEELSKGCSFGELVQGMFDRYEGVDRSMVESDVEEFINSIRFAISNDV